MNQVLNGLRGFPHLGFFIVWFGCVLASAVNIVYFWNKLSAKYDRNRVSEGQTNTLRQ